ncbi:DUF2188 domain-containing protein [Caulobacter radicis]|uniref:DUF2188 domain-containing protein n=1 Tax=Caulobacter radicis TaxID=2172650 RepID=A0A2T9JTR6_9CAUL|nr:hypothetical protein DDF65_05440 [Caulobacter radicis]
MARTIYRVLPEGGDWKVTRSGTRLAGYARKDDAIDYGRRSALADQPSQLVISRADGTFETEYTYGNDPYPPPG